jgi:hypothetical protein
MHRVPVTRADGGLTLIVGFCSKLGPRVVGNVSTISDLERHNEVHSEWPLRAAVGTLEYWELLI